MPLAITAYQWYLAIHILAVVIWVGSGFGLLVLIVRMRAEDDARSMAALLRGAEFMGPRIFGGSGLVALVFGLILVSKGDWPWDFWVIFGLVGWAAAFAHGAGVLGVKAGKLIPALDSEGWSDRVKADFSSYVTHMRLDALLLVFVVLDMALKPGA